MQTSPLNEALQLNIQIKYNILHCETKTLCWLLKDNSERLINRSAEQSYNSQRMKHGNK